MTVNEAPPVVPYPPVPPYGQGAPGPLPYPAPPRRRRGVFGAVAAIGVVGLLAGVGVGAYAAGRSSVPAPVTPPAPIASAAAAPVVSPEDAQADTCGVLKTDYEAVANAIDETNKFTVNDWTNPDQLAAANNLVVLAQRLADKLQGTLGPTTPPSVTSAMTDYIAGLRALSIGHKNHAPAKELNGIALLYNQVLAPPLHICGIPG